MADKNKSDGRPAYVSAGIAALVALSEAELQARVVEPLLRARGFTHVRNTSGPGERGKDLVAIWDEFGKPKLYAIQIKKLRPTGKHSHPHAFGALLTQLRQAILEDVPDPMTNMRRPPDRCYFITPYEIPSSAIDLFTNQLRETERLDIMVIDGPLLIDQLLKYNMLDVLRSVGGMELEYKTRFAGVVNMIPESHVFGIRDGLELDKIYVEMSLGHQGEELVRVLEFRDYSKATKILSGMPGELQSIKGCCKVWGLPCIWCPPRKSSAKRTADVRAKIKKKKNRITKRIQSTLKKLEDAKSSVKQLGVKRPFELSDREKSRLTQAKFTLRQEDRHLARVCELKAELRQTKRLKVYEFDSSWLLRTIQNEGKTYVKDLSRLAAQDLPEHECTAIIKRGMSLARKMRSVVKITQLKELRWQAKTCSIADKTEAVNDLPAIPANKLERIRLPAYVVGPPGVGKTTLLRRLAQRLARKSDGQLPILLYMVCVTDPSENGLVNACLAELNDLRYKITKRELLADLRNGKYHLILDGLDEAGDRAQDLMATIQLFTRTYSRSRLTLSSRDTLDLGEIKGAIHVTLLPFTQDQLDMFLEKWFTARPSALEGIKTWLDMNPQMRKAARVPLIAALLCSLYAADADMPATETELYQERFDLLLGKWEQAKGIKPMPVNLRNRYWHFLMSVAIAMHRETQRAMQRPKVVRIAKEYFSKTYHQTADAMVVDCIYRGLFEQDNFGKLSCGHLTYQEFLVGKWLAERNPVDIVWEKLVNPWWKKAIEFYTSLKQDISPLIEEGMRHTINSAMFRRVEHLVELAPLTSKTLFTKFRTLPWG